MEKSFFLADRIKTDVIGSEMVVYHPNENIYIANETAKLILQSVAKRNSVADIVDIIKKTYDVSSDMAEADVKRCLAVLLEKAIIRSCD